MGNPQEGQLALAGCQLPLLQPAAPVRACVQPQLPGAGRVHLVVLQGLLMKRLRASDGDAGAGVTVPEAFEAAVLHGGGCMVRGGWGGGAPHMNISIQLPHFAALGGQQRCELFTVLPFHI